MNDKDTPASDRQTAPEVDEADLLTPEADDESDKLRPTPQEVELPEEDDDTVPDELEKTEEPSFEAVVMRPERGLKRLCHGYMRHKKWTIPLTLLLFLAGSVGLPQTRYVLLRHVLKRDFAVLVQDKVTHQPVTNAQVTLDGQKKETDNHGLAHFRVNVGERTLKTAKKYYRTDEKTVLVAAWGSLPTYKFPVQATGRQVPVSVTNKITGLPVENAMIRAADTEVHTDKDGKAVIVLPTGTATLSASISADNFNEVKASITITAATVPANKFTLTPAGKVYFLSNLSGNIDLVKTNLDGTNRQTVLAGTGNESDHDTQLLQTSDWKYLVLKARRSTAGAALYVINTANDDVSTVDEGDADFTPVGWSGHHFVYTTNRHNVPLWKPYAQALKTYDADSAKTTVIDQTTGEGTNQFDFGYNSFSQVFLLGNELVYAKNWYGSGFAPNHLAGKHLLITSAQADGGGRRTIKDFPVPGDMAYSYTADFSQYAADGLYVQLMDAMNTTYFAYQHDTFSPNNTLTFEKFYARTYTTHYASADDTQTFWVAGRDGKSAVFVGDKNGDNGKQVALLDGLMAYGWYGNDYLLLYNNKSELFVMPAGGGQPSKITDFRLSDQIQFQSQK